MNGYGNSNCIASRVLDIIVPNQIMIRKLKYLVHSIIGSVVAVLVPYFVIVTHTQLNSIPDNYDTIVWRKKKLPFYILVFAIIAEGNACPLNSLCSNAVKRKRKLHILVNPKPKGWNMISSEHALASWFFNDNNWQLLT